MASPSINPKSAGIWVLLLVGFAAMEFPGVFFFDDKAEPYILGLPFIYGYIILWWIYMCVVLLYAYRINWGRPDSDWGRPDSERTEAK